MTDTDTDTYPYHTDTVNDPMIECVICGRFTLDIVEHGKKNKSHGLYPCREREIKI